MTMIKLYYIGVPVLMTAQTVLMAYMALVLNKISKRRRRRKEDA